MNLFTIPVRQLAKGKHSVFIFHKTPTLANPISGSEFNLTAFKFLLDHIAENFKVVALEESIANFGNKPWSERLASITFDDGYADWLTGVVPELINRQLPATFFISTGQFSGEPLWHERIIHAISKCKTPSIRLSTLTSEPREFKLGTLAEKKNAVLHLENTAKYLTLSQRYEILDELEKETNSPRHTLPIFQPNDVRKLHNLGFGIGAHTVNHPILSHCNIDAAKIEIGEARETLSHITSGPIHGFAYPNGISGKDFSAEHVELVKQAGYNFAVTTDPGAADNNVCPYLLPRFTPWGTSQATINYQIARNLITRPTLLAERKAKDKKVLMIAFHFPPQAGSSGVQRTLNFVRHLPKHGWQPTVLTAVESAYETTRDDLLKTLPAETRIRRAFALDTARHLSIAGKYLRLMAIPDRWISWGFFGTIKGHQLVKNERPDIIWSTYPLATANLIAAKLANKFQIPWVADFRDPMIINETCPSDPLERWAKRHIEGITMRQASCCIFTTPHAAELHRSRYPFAAEKCLVIPNGFDNDAFEGMVPNRYGVTHDTLLMLHSGLIYPNERDPTTFFQAIKDLINTKKIDRQRLKIRFRGSGNDNPIDEIIKRFQFQDIVELLPTIPFREAVAEMAGADILLVFQGSQFNPQIPAKIYEYLRAGSVIFGVVDHKGSAAAELRKFEGTFLADIHNSNQIAEVLTVALTKTGTEHKLQYIESNRNQLFTYSREAQTERLAGFLNSVIENNSQVNKLHQAQSNKDHAS
jgi:peptidoglycan/xylan/chitin deacetylase (PgdA/CDA1 family)/glycosyltransferase involved in cell wall biosynthesis